MEDNDIMKEGKSITQFPRHDILIGNELFLVNQIQSNGGYISRYMTLDALRDYILGTMGVTEYFLITESDSNSEISEQPIITEEDDNIVCSL